MKKSFAVAWLALATLPALAAAPVLVKDAWVRKAPGAGVVAVYLSLRNTGLNPIVVIGAQSSVASHAMMHETSLVNGQSQMRMRERIVIAPGQTVSFAPGGLHIMLSGLKQEMAVGQKVPLVLLLADGGKVSVAAPVKPLVTP